MTGPGSFPCFLIMKKGILAQIGWAGSGVLAPKAGSDDQAPGDVPDMLEIGPGVHDVRMMFVCLVQRNNPNERAEVKENMPGMTEVSEPPKARR